VLVPITRASMSILRAPLLCSLGSYAPTSQCSVLPFGWSSLASLLLGPLGSPARRARGCKQPLASKSIWRALLLLFGSTYVLTSLARNSLSGVVPRSLGRSLLSLPAPRLGVVSWVVLLGWVVLIRLWLLLGSYVLVMIHD